MAGVSTNSNRSSFRAPVIALLVGVSYVICNEIGFLLTPANYPLSTLWPPNAMLLAAFVLAPLEMWTPILVAVVPAHLLVQLSTGVPLPTSLGWFMTNTGQAVFAAACLRNFTTQNGLFNSVRGICFFISFGVILAPMVFSFLDAAVVVGTGRGQNYWVLFERRFISNVLANLTVVPPIVTILTGSVKSWFRAKVGRYVEAVALAIGIVVVSFVVFGGHLGSSSNIPAQIYTPLPFLLWAAFRFGTVGVSASLLAVAFISIWNAMNGRGPFTTNEPVQNVLSLQLFLIVINLALLGLAAGIQDRQRIVRALRQNEERMQLAAETVNLGLWNWYFSTDTIWATDSYRQLLGLKPHQQLSPDLFFEAIHPEDRDRSRLLFEEARRLSRNYEHEFRVIDHGGSLRWLSTKARHSCDSVGKAVSLTGVIIDVTERKMAEIDAQEQRRELMHLTRVAILGQLSGSFAHELNQPLTAILSNAQAAQNYLNQAPPNLVEVREILDDIVTDNKRAGEVIQRLRGLLKRSGAQFEQLDLNEITREALRLTHSELVARNVSVTTRLQEGLPIVTADRVQIQQVMLNLILNACEAMVENEPDERQLNVSTTTHPTGSVRVSITDRGSGIPPEIMARVFEPFVTTKEQGLGLGLAICKSIINLHGGGLWAINNPERGATLNFTLPPAKE